ncbi:MAG: hypothetical protein GX494_12050 [Clostridiaceae bacterium]|nr:hypothetical protein [Clostridiaceae bacterium]
MQAHYAFMKIAGFIWSQPKVNFLRPALGCIGQARMPILSHLRADRLAIVVASPIPPTSIPTIQRSMILILRTREESDPPDA